MFKGFPLLWKLDTVMYSKLILWFWPCLCSAFKVGEIILKHRPVIAFILWPEWPCPVSKLLCWGYISALGNFRMEFSQYKGGIHFQRARSPLWGYHQDNFRLFPHQFLEASEIPLKSHLIVPAFLLTQSAWTQLSLESVCATVWTGQTRRIDMAGFSVFVLFLCRIISLLELPFKTKQINDWETECWGIFD